MADKKIEDIPVQTTIQLKEETVNELKQIRASQQAMQVDIGGLEAQKHILLHRLHTLGEKLEGILKGLEEEHGKGSISLDKGELTLDAEENGNS